MSLIIPLDTAPTFPPREATATPDRLIEGAPAFKTWDLDNASGPANGWTSLRSGVWEATPGMTKSIKGDTFEYCLILEGRAEISEEGGETHLFGPGDSFVMKPGFVGTWKTLETLRKIFLIAS